MSTLKERLKADLSAAMKARDDVRTRTIRMALAAISTEEVAGKAARELSDDEVVKVLTKEAKKRKEAAEAFAGAGREEQAQAERAEQAVLEEYLPEQLSDEELTALVDEVIAEVGAERSEERRVGKSVGRGGRRVVEKKRTDESGCVRDGHA